MTGNSKLMTRDEDREFMAGSRGIKLGADLKKTKPLNKVNLLMVEEQVPGALRIKK